jgi:putative hemolysin
VPVFFSGGNSLPFHLLGAIHPVLRTLRLPHELLRMRGGEVTVRLGRPIPAAALEDQDDATAIRYLRARTYFLGAPDAARKPRTPWTVAGPKPLAEPVPAGVLEGELDALPAEARLSSSGEFDVLAVEAGQAPQLLREIGRLRELAFRQVGEGTGRRLDLDRYDNHYVQLVLWHRARRLVAGGYRLVSTTGALPTHGIGGLYTSTLFRYQPEFFSRLGPALELGRSFVHPEFQRSYAPLLALWRAIGAYVCRRPEHRILFGPVSISREYSDASRRLMARTLTARCPMPELERLVSARHPFRDGEAAARAGRLLALDMDDLSALISEVEPDGKAVPVLLRQYLKLGGRVVGFNVDPRFSGVVDSLLVVDLLGASPALLERYLGKSGSAGFLAWHRERAG